jgi:hypothetical protein
MGNINSININSVKNMKIINFDDMNDAIKKNYIIINTLDENNQECLIQNTISPNEEIKIINEYLNKSKDKHIIIYGKNNNDEKIFLKYKQLMNLGFTNIYLYIGGLFEWLLLQEIYGDENFPTTSKEIDILKYK